MSLPPGADFTGLAPPVVVACSGGSDSLALLSLAVEAGLAPVAVHVDHGLRPTAGTEATRVGEACDRLGARFDARSVAVDPGANIEARARRARYAALEHARLAHGAGAVLVGHTMDDQAETVLLQLLRGAGSAGLGAMRPRLGMISRPLLGVRRSELRAICRARGLAPLDDPMNRDPRYRRVFLRREVLPQLIRSARRDLVPVLARQAALMRDESDYLDGVARAALAALLEPVGPGISDATAPRAKALAELDVVVARRVVRVWLGPPSPSADEVERVLLVAAGSVRATELAGARRVERRRGRLKLSVSTPRRRGSTNATAPPLLLELPGTTDAAGWRYESWIERDAPVRWPDGRWRCVLDAATAGDGVRLVDASAGAILLRADGSELWRVGYGVAAAARVRPTTRRFLWLSAQQIDGNGRDGEVRTVEGADVVDLHAAPSHGTGASV